MKKQVLVTGANKGIGYEIARHLGKSGWQVVVGARCEDRALKAMEALRAEGADVAGWQYVNLADNGEIEVSAREIAEKYPGLSLLVNNAGITRDGLLMTMKEADFDAVLDTNLKGAFCCCKAVYRPMMRQRYGRIVNLSSVVALRGNAGQTNYAASKAGLIGLTKSLARELAARNVTVNAVAPGFIDTDMTAVLPETVRTGMTQGIPAGRAGQPEDVAQAVAFFAAEQSSYLTGQVLCADGGMAM